MKSIIIGTAGHIDHGKTALVKALTGIDADRLEEEKRRGITIDLGFAHMELQSPDGEVLHMGFVDVPGHERFIRNMLAGVGGIDLVLLVIAADEGIKPQTREHFDICRLLGVRRGITVLTKSDAVDQEMLDVVRLEVEDFLRGSFLDSSSSPIVAVSSLTREGIQELKQEISRIASEVGARDSPALAPIDRVFTMRGFGTVVTGTLISGVIRKEDELEVFPSGKRVRVRGVQVHGAPAEQAVAGQRTAVNLAGATVEELSRGMTLAPPETFRSAQRVDVSLSLLASAKPLKSRSRVHFHAYTMETIAEVTLYDMKMLKPGGTSHAQLKLAEAAQLLPGDRFIVRQFSPVVTIGGGMVLDAAPPTRKPKGKAYFLKLLDGRNPREILEARIARHERSGLAVSDLTAETGWPATTIRHHLAESIELGKILQLGGIYLHGAVMVVLKHSALDVVEAFHRANPLVAGISKEQLRETVSAPPEVFSALLDILVGEKTFEVDGEIVRLPGRGVVMKDEEAESKKIIEAAFSSAGLRVPFLKDVLAGLKVDKARAQKIVTLMLRDKLLVKVSEELTFHHSALAELKKKISALKASTPKIDVARFKDLTGVSRKYAIPLLEYLDRERVTKRVGDVREIL